MWWLLRHQFLHAASYSSCFLCRTRYCCLWNRKDPWDSHYSPQGLFSSRVRMGICGSWFSCRTCAPPWTTVSVLISFPFCLCRVYFAWPQECNSCLSEEKGDDTNPRFLPLAFTIPSLLLVKTDSLRLRCLGYFCSVATGMGREIGLGIMRWLMGVVFKMWSVLWKDLKF